MSDNPYNDKVEAKPCAQCGTFFEGHPDKKYCKESCKQRAKNVRKKLKEPPKPEIASKYRTEILFPTIMSLDALCKTLTGAEHEGWSKIGYPLPLGWKCPDDIALILYKHTDHTKNYYLLFSNKDGAYAPYIETDMDEYTKERLNKIQDDIDKIFVVKNEFFEASKLKPPTMSETVFLDLWRNQIKPALKSGVDFPAAVAVLNNQ